MSKFRVKKISDRRCKLFNLTNVYLVQKRSFGIWWQYSRLILNERFANSLCNDLNNELNEKLSNTPEYNHIRRLIKCLIKDVGK